ncbi:MAG: AEC family transporter [bacterium]
MAGWLVVLLKIVAMFLVIMAGWLARRRDFITGETTVTLSKFIVGLAMPALVFISMLTTVTPATIGQDWYLPLIGAGLIIVGLSVGWAVMPFFRLGDLRPTFLFLIAIANWVYLPLPIVDALYGIEGVRVVLLFNVGAQLMLWTVGVWTLRGGKPDRESITEVLTNAGIIAAAVGILLALLFPVMHTLGDAQPAGTFALVAAPFYQAIKMIGDLTIPLALVVTGAQLGGLRFSEHRPTPALYGVLGARLLLAPLALAAIFIGFAALGWRLPEIPRLVSYIIIAMPVAISCSIFTERFGGDTSLAARAVFYSTLLSIVTVPAIFFLVQKAGL